MTLRKFRIAAGLTQLELARKAQISRASISQLESGMRPPSPRLGGRICRALSAELGVKLNTWTIFPEHFKVVFLPADPAPHPAGPAS